MSKLSAFLHPVCTQEEKEIVVSARFVKRDNDGNPVLDENGNMIPETFKIRALTQEENDQITKQATRQIKVNGQPVEKVDSADYTRRMIVAATVDPDFRSKELCDAHETLDPLLVPGKMLFSGEYAALGRAIMSLSGFNSVEEDLKN